MRAIGLWAAAAVICCAATAASAQASDPVQGERALDARARRAVVASVIDSLGAAYVFPDSVAVMAGALRRHERRGAYNGLGARALADSLTAHLRAVRDDGHLRVVYAPEAAAAGAAVDTAAEAARGREEARRANHGVARVEHLPGNVGYLALDHFGEPSGVEPLLAAAMTLLARTDALIIDLRGNGGGYPPTAALLAGYLLGPDSVHLLSFYYRPTRETFDSWTPAKLAGPRYGPGRPVHVLTDRGTVSAAEAFAYTLKHAGRVTVTGETTGGHAHPGRNRRVGHGIAVFVPDGRPTSPVTGANWEGTGVAPDVVVPGAQALAVAHSALLRDLARRAADPELRRELAALAERAGASSPARP